MAVTVDDKRDLEQQRETSNSNSNTSFEFSSDEKYIRDPKVEMRILRKIDIRLLPILGTLYTICLVDRSNISVARISGLDQDVDLNVGSRASIV